MPMTPGRAEWTGSVTQWAGPSQSCGTVRPRSCFRGGGQGASVQRPPQEGAPSCFPSGLLPPVSCIRPHLSWSRTLPCPLSFLLVLIATQSITYLMVLQGPLPQEVRMEQIEGVKGTEHSGWKMLCLPPPCLLILVRLATSMFLLFLCGKKLSNNLIQG